MDLSTEARVESVNGKREAQGWTCSSRSGGKKGTAVEESRL